MIKNQIVLLLLGVTGAGMSTIFHLLAGSKVEETKMQEEKYFLITLSQQKIKIILN